MSKSVSLWDPLEDGLCGPREWLWGCFSGDWGAAGTSSDFYRVLTQPLSLGNRATPCWHSRRGKGGWGGVLSSPSERWQRGMCCLGDELEEGGAKEGGGADG